MLSISYRCIAFALLIYVLLKDNVDLPAYHLSRAISFALIKMYWESGKLGKQKIIWIQVATNLHHEWENQARRHATLID